MEPRHGLYPGSHPPPPPPPCSTPPDTTSSHTQSPYTLNASLYRYMQCLQRLQSLKEMGTTSLHTNNLDLHYLKFCSKKPHKLIKTAVSTYSPLQCYDTATAIITTIVHRHVSQQSNTHLHHTRTLPSSIIFLSGLHSDLFCTSLSCVLPQFFTSEGLPIHPPPILAAAQCQASGQELREGR